jgi:hypothetical protein
MLPAWVRLAKMTIGFISPKCTSISYPGRSAARSGALQTRDRSSLWRSRISDAPLRCRSRCVASGTRDGVGRVRSLSRYALAGPIPVFSCFSADSESSIPGHTHTHTTSFPRRVFCARGLQLCFANPNRGVGGAPRDVRVLGGTPVGRIMCVKDARERAYDAIRQARARRLASHSASRRA